ncbi:MAG: glycine cleavage system protein GcvH [Deltaproteobacteria bacterium]|jgi:glycine cleavage system H protein|nr:MAG: glycine cleavage system protein GcvH [Deltaproteobacteria bacterium]TNF25809.1 MAG: glycine cleavage system protein GcvH [Deltaproteobacteria bacterium]
MAHSTPEELKYTKEHEWVKIDGNTAIVGITDFAQSSLGDIVFVELPESGTELSKDSAFGVVESIKSVSDLYSPLTGTVTESNQELVDQPELCNQSPYDSWMIKLEVTNEDEISELLDAAAYQELCANQD